jgi:hypothetical protein
MQLARYINTFQKRLLLPSLRYTSEPSKTLFMTHGLSVSLSLCPVPAGTDDQMFVYICEQVLSS